MASANILAINMLFITLFKHFLCGFTLFTEMNSLMMQMRHTAHELRVTLDHVLQGGEAAAVPQTSHDETVSFLGEAGEEMREELSNPEVSALVLCLLIKPFWEDCASHLNAVIVGELMIQYFIAPALSIFYFLSNCQ